MDYRPRKGIILLKICDANLLVPLREASDACKEIASISVFETLVWKRLEKGEDMDTVITAFSKLASRPPEDIRARIDSFLDNLYGKGFIVKTDEAFSMNEDPRVI